MPRTPYHPLPTGPGAEYELLARRAKEHAKALPKGDWLNTIKGKRIFLIMDYGDPLDLVRYSVIVDKIDDEGITGGYTYLPPNDITTHEPHASGHFPFKNMVSMETLRSQW